LEDNKAGRSRARAWWALALLAVVLALLGLFYLYSTGTITQALPKGLRPPATPAGSPDTGARFSLTVSPGRVVIPQGATHQETSFQVSNSGGENLDLVVATSELSQLPDGSVIFNRPTPGSAASWVVATPRTFSLQPGQTQMVQVTIDIPVQPDPGDHQVGLTFLVPVKGSGGTVNINRGIGTQLLIAVPGPIVHGVLLPGLSAPWFSDGGPVPLTLTVRNQGTVHEDYYAPNGILGSASGGRVTFSDFSVLRQTTRTVRGEWDNPPLLCWCSVRAYGDDGNGTTMSASTRVLVFPFRLLIGLIVAMVGLYLARSEIRNRRSAARAAATAALETKLEEARRQGFEEAARAGVPPPAASPRKGSGSGVARPRAPVDGDAGNDPAARRRPRRRGDKQS
jgi:hypothetical protein